MKNISSLIFPRFCSTFAARSNKNEPVQKIKVRAETAVAANPKKTTQENTQNEQRSKCAFNAMLEIRNALYRRLVDYVIVNESRMMDEAGGEDSYSFTLQQLDEQFLNKLNVVERAVGELNRCEHREGQTTTTTYEAVEIIARRQELPQKVADALAEHGDSDFLDLCVLRADDKTAEVLLVMAREDSGSPPVKTAKPERQEQGEHEQGDSGDESASGSGPESNAT
jgi:hypothetical protein